MSYDREREARRRPGFFGVAGSIQRARAPHELFDVGRGTTTQGRGAPCAEKSRMDLCSASLLGQPHAHAQARERIFRAAERCSDVI